jgi:hypothetical protein
MTDVFDSVAPIGSEGYETGVEGTPQRVVGEYVTPDYFRVLRTQPLLGRAFTHVVVLSYGLWKDLFAGDRNVSVMPEGFADVDADARLGFRLPSLLSRRATMRGTATVGA